VVQVLKIYCASFVFDYHDIETYTWFGFTNNSQISLLKSATICG